MLVYLISSLFIYLNFVTSVLYITSPVASDVWESSKNVNIKWIDSDTNSTTNNNYKINIELVKGKENNLVSEKIIGTADFNDKNFNWTVPNNLETSPEYSIKISSPKDPKKIYFSHYFQIKTPMPPKKIKKDSSSKNDTLDNSNTDPNSNSTSESNPIGTSSSFSVSEPVSAFVFICILSTNMLVFN